MFRSILLIAVLSYCAFCAPKLPKPDRIPAPPTSDQVALIREGVALHDQAKYEEAIAKYKAVLAVNPWEVTALHELAYTYFESKQYDKALLTAQLGAQCRSEALPAFHTMMGNALDEMGKAGEAIQLFKAAIKQSPRTAMLHYNFAITLRKAGKQNDAKAAVQKALYCNPNHPSSHLVLASLYRDMGYRVPAIMAYSSFLALEPESPRSPQALDSLVKLINQGVSQGKEPNQINIFVTAPSKATQDEGDFAGAEMMISISLAADGMAKPNESDRPLKTQYEKIVGVFELLGESLGNSKPKGGFAARFYAPYFAALAKNAHTGAFIAATWKSAQVEGTSEWLKENGARVPAFQDWSKAYRWPEE